MKIALAILEEESPKEFFRTRRIGRGTSVLQPMPFGKVRVGMTFATNQGTAYRKTCRNWAVEVRRPDSEGFVFSESRVVYPTSWDLHQIGTWKEADLRRRRFGESEDPKEFFRTRHVRPLPNYSVLRPMRFAEAEPGDWFTRKDGTVWCKVFLTCAVKGSYPDKTWSSENMAHGMPSAEIVYPVNWSVSKAKEWLAKNPSS